MTIIAVTTGNDDGANRYLEVIEKLGAIPTRLTPGSETSLQQVDGLLLTGGPDVDPTRYQEKLDPDAGVTMHRERDDLEFTVLQNALERDMPVLAICRGMQLMNVAFGGKLIQDLPGHKSEGHDGTWESAYHQVDIESGTKLASILGSSNSLKVNSRHHQGLKAPQKASALIASAVSPEDGYIEGLESPLFDWIVGVQWHPERVDEVPDVFQRLFAAFVEKSKGFSERVV